MIDERGDTIVRTRPAVTQRQAAVLELLVAQPMHAADLADALRPSMAGVGSILVTLFIRGWVERTRVPRGQYVYRATPAGGTALADFRRRRENAG